MRTGILQAIVVALLVGYTLNHLIPADIDRFYVLVFAVLLGTIVEMGTGGWRRQRFY